MNDDFFRDKNNPVLHDMLDAIAFRGAILMGTTQAGMDHLGHRVATLFHTNARLKVAIIERDVLTFMIVVSINGQPTIDPENSASLIGVVVSGLGIAIARGSDGYALDPFPFSSKYKLDRLSDRRFYDS